MRAYLPTLNAVAAASIVTSALATARADFSYAFVFGQPSEMILNGSAFYDESNTRAMTLTSDGGQDGSMWFQTPQYVAGGFTTTFSFRIDEGPTTHVPGDGFALVLQNDPAGTAALGGGGGALGYGTGNNGSTLVQGLTNSLAVEFDTFSFTGDGPEVAIHSMGANANSADEADALASALLSSVTSINILDGQKHTCTIEYKAAVGSTPSTLVVYLDNTLVLSAPINLQDIAGDDITNGGSMYVGLTGSTGLADSIQVIPEWGFAEVADGCLAPYWHLQGWGGCGLGCYSEMEVQVIGSTPQTYRWYVNGVEIVGSQSGHYSGLGTNHLRVESPTLADNGYYKVVVSNDCGSTNSLEVFLGTCPGDVDDGGGTGTPDGGVDVNDLIYFLQQFESGAPGADLSWQNGGAIRDGAVDINDLLFFLASFEGGC